MNYLVTGGAGFIGSELVRELVTAGNRVIAVDNLVNGKRENLDGLPEDRVELVVADIRDGDRMLKVIRGAEVVFHLACLGVRHSIHSPDENHEVNASATLRLLSAARDAGVRRFVYVSSSEVYGTARWVPMIEEHPTFPMTAYGASKLAGECYARAFHRTYGFPAVVVRPFNTYGPRMRADDGRAVPNFINQALAGKPLTVYGDGSQTRSFCYVDDLINALKLVLKKVADHRDRAGGRDVPLLKIVNLGNAAEMPVLELAEKIKAMCNSESKIVFEPLPEDDPLQRRPQLDKAKAWLGFEPKIGLEEGLSKVIAWFADERQLQSL